MGVEVWPVLAETRRFSADLLRRETRIESRSVASHSTTDAAHPLTLEQAGRFSGCSTERSSREIAQGWSVRCKELNPRKRFLRQEYNILW